MKMTLTGRRITPRPTFAERTQGKLDKLDKYFEQEMSADVTLSQERSKVRVEITIHGPNLLLRAEQVSDEANDAVDKLMDILVRQIRRYKTRLGKRLRQAAFAQDSLPDEEPDLHIVRSKTFPVKPMDVEEAVMQMNLTEHQFYMFRNADTDEINVVYRRNDGGYGLLEPDNDK